MNTRNKLPIGIAALFGAWMFVSAFVLGMPNGHFWNNVVVGAVIAIVAAYSAITRGGSRSASGLATILGLWSIVTPFVYASSTTMLWSDVISGIIIAVLAGYDTYVLGTMREAESEATQPTP